MATPVVGDIYLVTFYGLVAGQTILNTFRYRLETLGTAVTTDDIYNNMETLLTSGGNLFPKFLASIPSQYVCQERWYQRVFPTRIRKKIAASGLAGTLPGTAVSPNVAASIERYAETATRHGVGRVQLVAASDTTNMVNGSITAPGYTAALAALATQMTASLTLPVVGSTMKPVLQDLKTPGVFNYVVGAAAKTTARVMRRRTLGVGK